MVDDYLAALFIDVAYQNNGAGKELLNFEKRQRTIIQLKVYKENLSAVRFYEKIGFIIKKELTDEQTIYYKRGKKVSYENIRLCCKCI
ncbi:GNAT family N-acetyltransferase [Sporosarcina koreensis]|uniref:GNAT family N-acetyltransferase n=1 Tax=Bacillales TaxID=1385 RepID=UPI001F1EF353|nr:GNAT family N-acetyltransferase [Sporosarcina koreensis]